MLTKVGEVYSYKELTQEFIKFLQCQSATVQPWDKLSDKPQTFYGTTLAIPIEDYEPDTSFTKSICVIPSSGIMFDRGTLFPNGEIMYYSLTKLLKKVFPNANVFEYEHNGARKGERSLEQVYDSLQYVTADTGVKPDYVVCGGIDWTVHRFTIETWDVYGKQLLNNIYNFCKTNNIELCMAYFPELTNTTTVENGYEDKFALQYCDDYYERIERYIFPTGDRIYNGCRWILKAMDVDKPSDATDKLFTFSREFNHWFETPMYTKAKLRLIMNRFFHKSRPEYYLTLQDMEIKGDTYSKFFNSPAYYQTEEFNHVTGYPVRTFAGHRGINLFKHTGEMIAFGLHTAFDYKLWMCEQGGVTCRYEADKQFDDADLLPFYEGRPILSTRLETPVFPGTGCPWLTIADKNKTAYGIRLVKKTRTIEGVDIEEIDPSSNGIHYYFTKTNHNATITVRICDKNGILPDCWQSIAFGRFEGDYTYKMPLYVAGGTSALSPDVWVYFPPSSRVNGYEYDLSMRNINFSNSNLLHPAKMRDGHLSNFRVLANDGHWRDIYSVKQTFKEFQYFHPCGVIFQWGVPVYPPEQINGDEYHTGFNLLNKKGLTDTSINKKTYDGVVKGRPEL